jgi:hypothetical protein
MIASGLTDQAVVRGMMCSSTAATVLADTLEVLGFTALIIGFFSALTKRGTQSKWSAAVFLIGVVAIVVGYRLPGFC